MYFEPLTLWKSSFAEVGFPTRKPPKACALTNFPTSDFRLIAHQPPPRRVWPSPASARISLICQAELEPNGSTHRKPPGMARRPRSRGSLTKRR
jgi:hypothetical protein